jgi:hypothetical protein
LQTWALPEPGEWSVNGPAIRLLDHRVQELIEQIAVSRPG